MKKSSRNQRRYDWLISQLERTNGRLDARGMASQLAYSSFDAGDGHSIDETSPETGNPVASFGTQFDGSHGSFQFTGPVPATPTSAFCEVGPDLLVAGWDGLFVDGAGDPDILIPTTMDFSHVEVHASQDPLFTAEFSTTMIGTINTARGGKVAIVASSGTWYVRLVARTLAGKRSAASERTQIYVPVLEHTNPDTGYTSTVTGKGLRVFRTVGGQQIDVIRLGTFGRDYLSISDELGVTKASISGEGDMSSENLYGRGEIYASGKRLGDKDGPRGEVGYGMHAYTAGNTPSSWQTHSTSGAGIIEVAFRAERGRAYRLTGHLKYFMTVVPSRFGIVAVYRNGPENTGGNVPSIAAHNGYITVPGAPSPGNGIESHLVETAAWGEGMPFGGRFVPLPHSTGGNDRSTLCRVLIYGKVTAGSGGPALAVEHIEASIEDMGWANSPVSWYGQNNGLGTSTLPAAPVLTTTLTPTSVRNFKEQLGSPTVPTYDAADTANVLVGYAGTDPAYMWRSAVQMDSLYTALSSAQVLEIHSIKLTMTPSWFADGAGKIVLGVAQTGTVAFWTVTSPPSDPAWFPEAKMVIGAWPVGETRTIELPEVMTALLRANNKALTFGMLLEKPALAGLEYAAKIPLSSISISATYRKKS